MHGTKALVCCSSEPQRLPQKDGAEAISADVFRGNSRRSPRLAPPPLIDQHRRGSFGFARELVTRLVVLKARGRVFDIQDGLGEGAGVWPGSLAVASSAPQGSQSLVSRGMLPVTVRITSFFVRSRRSWELGIPNVVSNRNSLPNECLAALPTRVVRGSVAGNMAANALNVHPHLFVRHDHLYPGIERSHRLPIGTLSWPLGSPNLLTSQSIVFLLAALRALHSVHEI